MKLTIEQKNKLHELAFASATNREIAEQLGLPISEVYAQRSQMGITRDKVALAKGEAPHTVMAKHIPLKRAKKPIYTFEDVTPQKEKAPEVEAQELGNNLKSKKNIELFFSNPKNFLVNEVFEILLQTKSQSLKLKVLELLNKI